MKKKMGKAAKMCIRDRAIAKGMVTEEKAAGYRERMLRVIGNLKKVTDASVEWYKRIKDEFLPAKRVIVVGYDGMSCDVLEGALKILATVRQGVAGYDICLLYTSSRFSWRRNSYFLGQ